MSINLAKAREQIATEAMRTHRLNENRQEITAGLLSRLGYPVDERHSTAAAEYGRMKLLDLFRSSNRFDGLECDIDAPDTDIVRSGFSVNAGSVDILTTATETLLYHRYTAVRNSLEPIADVTSGENFRDLERYRAEEPASLEPVVRGGTAGTYNPALVKETYRLVRFAKAFAVDEQDIVSDALNVIRAAPEAIGEAAGRLAPDLAYYLLLSNPAMADGVAFFHADHDNLDTGKALSDTNLAAGIASFETRTAVGDDGVEFSLDIPATHLYVPKALEYTALGLVRDIETTNGRRLTVVSDPRLSNGVIDPASGTVVAGSATSWYLASSVVKPIEIGYLGGRSKPIIRRTQLGQGQYGVHWDVYLDVGALLRDYRGMMRFDA